MGIRAKSKLLYCEASELLSDLKKHHPSEIIRDLQKSNMLKSVCAFGVDWLVVLLAVGLFCLNPLYFGIISIVLIGSRQRALSNLVHDASHWNLFSNKRVNDIVANVFAALPMFDTVEGYRKSHLDHHRYLGDIEKDPDAKNHIRYGYDDLNPPTENPLGVYLSLLLNSNTFKDSTVSGLLSLPVRGFLKVVAWWGILCGTLAVVFGLKISALFFGLWMLSRATTYHAIRLFAEFSDHAGLRLGSIIDFTRNMPHKGVLKSLFHPHEDTFHLIHHLLPKVPHYHLREMNAMLAVSPVYQNAHHCDAYFQGSHSAIDCWMGRCKGGIK